MRWVLATVVLLVCGFVSAAPVPDGLTGDRERLEQLWADLASRDPIVRTRAVFALVDHRKATPFLAEKAKPVAASAKQLKAWVKALDSDDEKEWKAAFDELSYYDPRLELSLPEQIELVTTHSGRRRLFGVLRDHIPDSQEGTYETNLTLGEWQPGQVKLTFSYAFRTPTRNGAGSTGFPVEPVAKMTPAAWRQTALAAVILDRIDTPASREVFDRIAEGHPDALPTRTAAAVRRAKFTLLPQPRLGNDWSDLIDDDPIQVTRWTLDLAAHPDVVRGLKVKLPPIRATKDEVTGWLTALNNDDPTVWRPAYQKMLYFRPLLAVSLQDQCELMTTDHGRSALYYLLAYPRSTPREIDVYPGRLVREDDDDWLILSEPRPGKDDQRHVAHVRKLATTIPYHWQRARVAIIALERVGTTDAKAVLKQLADGHPDILPTKEAKTALDRMKK